MLSLRVEEEIIASWSGGSNEPIVSICCLTYNHEKYIEEAIRGFLMQETDFPFEIIIHDDASTDRTSQIIEQYRNRYPKLLKVISQKINQYSLGTNPGFRFLLPAAMGKYIAICEGDDYWIDPLKINKQISFLEHNKSYSMCIHNSKVLNCITNNSYLFNSRKIPKLIKVQDVIMRRWFCATSSFVFRNGNTRFIKDLDANGDMLILYQNAMRGHVHYLEDVMSVYRLFTKGSLSEDALRNKGVLYRKKLNLLNYIDQDSGRKFILVTNFTRARVYIGLLLMRLNSIKEVITGKNKW